MGIVIATGSQQLCDIAHRDFIFNPWDTFGDDMDACLVLEDGSIFSGISFGGAPYDVDAPQSERTGLGEVIFNTSMTGYTEVLTDPSYTDQMLVMTYPHIGNYGVDLSWSEASSYEENTIQVSAFIVRSCYRGPLPQGRISLHEFLAGHGVPGIEGIDTRRLTLLIRDRGAQKGMIVQGSAHDLKPKLEDLLRVIKDVPDMEGSNLVSKRGTRTLVTSEATGLHVALLDCGAKNSIVRNLTCRGANITMLPNKIEAEEILKINPDMLFLSNGPGDPAALPRIVSTLRKLIGKLPIRGICLGHQLIAEALGAKTYKMPFGHHGSNHAIRDEQSGKIYVCSENHGFAVDEESLATGTEVWFRNSSDMTVEGIRDEKRNILSVQFHPEAAPGPLDTAWIFDALLMEHL